MHRVVAGCEALRCADLRAVVRRSHRRRCRRVTLAVNGFTIRCARVVVATGYATPSFEPLVGRFRMLQTYVVATKRIPARQRAKALRDGAAGVWQYFERHYPALEQVGIDFAWEGLFATTPDSLPYVGPHPDYPKHLFALGYGGNGMTFGFLAARLLLEWYEGKRTDDHRLFGFDRTVVLNG